jgi:hypothetical protein
MDDNELDSQGCEKGIISRRQALQGSVAVLSACYLAPVTMDLLLADSASAQGSGGENETFNSEFRCCNFLLNASDFVTVEFVDIFGPGLTRIPGGNDPDSGVSYRFSDLLDGGEVTVSTEQPAYYTFMTPEETVKLESFLTAGNDLEARKLMNAIASDDNGMITTLSFTLDNELKSLVVSVAAPE